MKIQINNSFRKLVEPPSGSKFFFYFSFITFFKCRLKFFFLYTIVSRVHNWLKKLSLSDPIRSENAGFGPSIADAASACLGQYLCFNVVKSSRNHMFIELKFIEYFIFWAKKQFLATFQKLA